MTVVAGALVLLDKSNMVGAAMKNLIKWVAIIGGGIIVLFILILLVLPLFIDAERFRPMLEQQVAEATGRSFAVGRDVDLSFFPYAGVAFTDLHLGNPAGFERDDFVSIQSFEVRVKLLPVLFGNIEVKRFVVKEPRLVAIKNQNGKVNWSFDRGKPTAPATEKPPSGSGTPLPIESLTVGDFAVNNGTLIYIDKAAGTRQVVENLDLTLQNLSLDQPVRVDLSARINDKPVAASGTVGPVGNDPGQGTIPLDITLTAVSALELKAQGSVSDPAANPRMDLAVRLEPFSARKLLSALNRSVPTDDPDALSRLSLQADVAGGPQSLTVSNGVLNLDDSTINFNAQASDFAKPVVSFKARVDRLNLDRYLPPPSPKTDETPPAASPEPDASPRESAAPDYAPLRRMVLDGQIEAGSLVVHRAELTDLRVQIRARNGIIRMDPIRLQLYGGTLSGKAVGDVREKSPAAAVDLSLQGVQSEPLLQEQLQKDFLVGMANADLELSLSGTTAAAILKTLDGRGQLRFNDGALKGFDLAAMVRNVKAAFGLEPAAGERPRTDFTELVIPFQIKKGVFSTTDSLLRSPLLRLTADGTVDFLQRTLDFRVNPKAVATLKGQGDVKQRAGMTVPITIQGSLAAPKFRPDIEAAARERIEKKVLESDKARELLEKEELKPYQEEAEGLLKKFLQ